MRNTILSTNYTEREKSDKVTTIALADVNPYVRYVAQANFEPLTRSIKAYDHRIFYILEGGCRLNICGRDNFMYPGSLAVIRPGDPYIFKVTDGFELVDINFDYTQEAREITEGVHPSFAEEFEEKRMFARPEISGCVNLNQSVVIHNMDRVRDELLHIAEEFELKKLFYRERASSMLKKLICDTARLSAAGKSAEDKRLDELLGYIKNNYNKPLTNTMIAAQIGYHPYYVNRLVKGYTGTTLRQYIINCRIDAVKKLLAETDKSVEEIAAECGFKNITHFSDCFKNKVGVSAAMYRKSFKKVL